MESPKTNKEILKSLCKMYNSLGTDITIEYGESVNTAQNIVRCYIDVYNGETLIGKVHRTSTYKTHIDGRKELLRKTLLRDILVTGIDQRIDDLNNYGKQN